MDIKVMLPILVLELLLLVIALVDLIRRDKRRVRWQNKFLWGIIIVVINILGPISYFVFGRTE